MLSRNETRRTFIPLSAGQMFFPADMDAAIVDGTNRYDDGLTARRAELSIVIRLVRIGGASS